MSIVSRTGGVSDVMRTLVRGRDVVVIAVAEAGRRPPPRALATVVAAVRERGLAVRVETLGGPVEGGVIVVALPGLRRRRRIPEGWLGEHLVLVAAGSAAQALASFVRATGDPEGGDPQRIAARMCEFSFASTTIVVGEAAPTRARSLAAQRFGPLVQVGSR